MWYSIIMLKSNEVQLYVTNLNSILVICQELYEKDFDTFFRKKGNLNRPSVGIFENRMSVRIDV